MSFLPEGATFHERVQDCFVAYRGQGLSFSAVDLEILDDWALSEVPFEVIARGLRKAAEAALWDAVQGQGRLRSLRSCRRHVGLEITKFQQRSARHTAVESISNTDFHLARHKKLVAAVKKAMKPQVPSWLSQLPVPTEFAAGDRQELLTLSLMSRALPFAQRLVILRQVRVLVNTATSMSPVTRRESLRFHRAALVRQAWALPTLW